MLHAQTLVLVDCYCVDTPASVVPHALAVQCQGPLQHHDRSFSSRDLRCIYKDHVCCRQDHPNTSSFAITSVLRPMLPTHPDSSQQFGSLCQLPGIAAAKTSGRMAISTEPPVLNRLGRRTHRLRASRTVLVTRHSCSRPLRWHMHAPDFHRLALEHRPLPGRARCCAT